MLEEFYPDTSVLNAYFDARAVETRQATQVFLVQAATGRKFYVSDVVLREVMKARNPGGWNWRVCWNK